MKTWPLRFRLTLWYFLILAASLLAFAAFTIAALEHAVHRTLDAQLKTRVTAVARILNEPENRSRSSLHNDLDEDVELAPDVTLMEIWNGRGDVIYRSAALAKFGVPELPIPTAGKPVSRIYHDRPLRMLAANISAARTRYIVLVALPTHDFAEAMERLRGAFLISIPLLLLLSASAGYWIAGRALSPISSMISVAEAIRPQDLSTRIQTPAASDELRRLAATLNSMLDRLQSAFERISRFTADASHELRTPVSLLRARTEILLRRPRTTEEYRAAHLANLAELERTSSLLEGLMLLARADAGAEVLELADLDFCCVVRAAFDDMLPLAQARSLAWTLALPSSPVPVRGDLTALRRLLLILFDNAIKYTQPEGSISVALQDHDPGKALLRVRDSGIGISAENLPHIFERFFRADPARGSGGAGLGLSIALWIASAHGGTLTAESAPGTGSEFTLALPRIGNDTIRSAATALSL